MAIMNRCGRNILACLFALFMSSACRAQVFTFDYLTYDDLISSAQFERPKRAITAVVSRSVAEFNAGGGVNEIFA